MAGTAEVSAPPGPRIDAGGIGPVWTVPNILSFLRLAGVPVFIWLVLGPHADGWAVIALMLAGLTDFFDGAIARRFRQFSRLGELLDPLADRLYILATIVTFTIRGIIPLGLAIAIPGRDLLLVGLLPVLRRHSYGPPPVHFFGKAATLCLLYAFPLLLLSIGAGTFPHVVRPIAWAFTAWGTGLYWFAGALYALQVRRLVRPDSAGVGSGA